MQMRRFCPVWARHDERPAIRQAGPCAPGIAAPRRPGQAAAVAKIADHPLSNRAWTGHTANVSTGAGGWSDGERVDRRADGQTANVSTGAVAGAGGVARHKPLRWAASLAR